MIKPHITPEQGLFLQRRLEVVEKTAALFSHLLDSKILPLDYLSIFTASESDRERLDAAAAELGAAVFNKRGQAYRLYGEPSGIVRVRDPNPEIELVGCADYVVDDYLAIRNRLIGIQGCTEMEKEINGEKYSIIEATEPEFQASIYFPSIRLTMAMIEADS